MSKQKKSVLVLISAVGLYLLFGVVGQQLFDCGNVGLQDADSPDGQYRATIGLRTCKDSTRDEVWLSFMNLETGSNVRSALIKDTSVTGFELNWHGNNELEITVPSSVDWGDLRGQTSFESVRVEYRASGVAPLESSN
ncbi:MAG: hypothetical protein GY924_05590 [Planctomycetaceae bacterium]|nr:hypothetical protein [Planctomycetaceae bacterium]